MWVVHFGLMTKVCTMFLSWLSTFVSNNTKQCVTVCSLSHGGHVTLLFSIWIFCNHRIYFRKEYEISHTYVQFLALVIPLIYIGWAQHQQSTWLPPGPQTQLGKQVGQDHPDPSLGTHTQIQLEATKGLRAEHKETFKNVLTDPPPTHTCYRITDARWKQGHSCVTEASVWRLWCNCQNMFVN